MSTGPTPERRPEGAGSDITPLAWVQDEVRRTLEGVHKTLRRQLREFDLRQASGQLDAAWTSTALQAQALNLHQVAGVLRLVNRPEGQRLMLAAEALLLRCSGDSRLVADQVEAVERAGFALLTYVSRLVAGARPSPLALFPAYRRLQELNHAERIHPADFWPQHFEWRTLPPPQLLDESLPSLDALRAAFETALLRQMRETNATHAAHLAELCAGIGLALGNEPQQSFWQLAAAHFEAQALGMLASDELVKRMASRLLAQLRRHMQGSPDVADRLVQDLLFFCAQSGEPPAGQAPRLRAVRVAYGLNEADVADYREDRLGRIDPAWVQQAQRRVNATKEAWSACAEGDLGRAATLDEACAHLTESLTQLFPGGDHLGQTLQRAAVVTLRAGARPPAALAMEMATALLYLEAALEDGDYDHPGQRARIERLAQRVQAAATGQPVDTLDGWMEDLFRRVADRQTLGSVMQELRVSLAEVERATDEYFRDPAKREHLIPVPGQLQAMRGVFTVLGLDDAATTCVRMRDEVDRLSNTEVDPSLPGPRAVFERLATNLGQLGFLIDMLSVQAPLAKSMFRFDAEKGELVATLERERRGRVDPAAVLPPSWPAPDAATLPAAAPPEMSRPPAPAALSLSDLDLPDLDLPDLDVPVLALGSPAATNESGLPTLALDGDHDQEVPALDAMAVQESPSAALTEPAPPVSVTAAPSAASGLTASPLVAEVPDDAPDAELLDIFLEEAVEVVGQAREALERVREKPTDKAALTDVRRAFHTLKGSSRMVGLHAFGDAAWACEQLFNARLAEDGAADTALLDFAADALSELDAWRADVAAGQTEGRSPQGLRHRADALRLGEAARADVRTEAVAEPLGLSVADSVAAPIDRPVETPPESLSDGWTEAPIDGDKALLVASHAARPAALDAEPPPGFDSTLPFEDLSAIDLELGGAVPAGVSFEATQALEVAVVPPAELPVDIPLVHLDLDLPRNEPTPADDDGFELDLKLPEPTTPIPAEALPSLELTLDLGAIEPVLEAAEADEPASLEETQAPEPVAETEAEAVEPTVQVGPLHLSEALFNIFTAEADEQSQRLATSLQDWAPVHDEPPPQASEAYAHALAGNAATVGFNSLSQLARALEHALGRAQQAQRVAEADAHAFVQAAQAIRGLLAGFGARQLGDADTGLIDSLHAYQPDTADTTGTLDGEALAASEPAAAVAAPAQHEFPLGEADAIDTELWDIFEEEATDLLQELHGRLRDWARHPQDGARGDACMRTLHTFKGGARLAGAMQLGEWAHRLESDVLALLSHGERGASDVQPLQDRGDELEQRFEALRVAQRGAPSEPLDLSEPAQAEAMPAPSADWPEPLRTDAAQPEPSAESELESEPISELVSDEALAPLPVEVPPRDPSEVDWQRWSGRGARELTVADAAPLVGAQALVRVRAAVLDRLASQSGEVSVRRARLENELAQMKTALTELDDNLDRLRTQLRELELQAEAQISSRQEAARAAGSEFDPLEFDRYTRFQEVTRMLAESVNDVATVQRSLQRNVAVGEDELAAQSRLTRELQDDLLRSRMVEFESVGERLHRVVRQAARENGKQVQLDIAGQGIELDRGVLERLVGSFEHLLRNAVVHGIENPEQRKTAGKSEVGQIRIELSQEGNQVLIAFQDDGAGLDLARIRAKAIQQGILQADQEASEAELTQLIFAPGFSTAGQVTELAGRGVGMDVVRAEVTTLGGYVLTRTQAGRGTAFDLRVPLTTALTQVVLLRVGDLQVAVPASLVDSVLRLPNEELGGAHESGRLKTGLGAKAVDVPIYWLGGLLAHSDHPQLHGKHAAVVLVHSGPDRIAIHVDEVVGNQEVVVKNLGPQLMHVPGLAGISLLASGQVALIYNPVALAERYGASALARAKAGGAKIIAAPIETQALAPLIMVVDDSLTVRRVTQRFLEREGLRVQLAKDGLDAMEQLAREDLPDMVLSDIEMPRMDGFDLVRNIRADERLARLPVVMITSRIAEKHRDYAAQLGVQGYLGKPYDEDTLLRLIRQHTAAVAAAVNG